MAYQRQGKQELEVDFPLEAIWNAIPQAVAELDWEIQSQDREAHQFLIRTKGAFMSYSSLLEVQLKTKDENTTLVYIEAVTPVTTITAVLDYGQTYDRINSFVLTLAKIMNTPPTHQ